MFSNHAKIDILPWKIEKQSHRGIHSCGKNSFKCRNTIIVNSHGGRFSSIEIFEKHSHRGVYSSGRWEFQEKF